MKSGVFCAADGTVFERGGEGLLVHLRQSQQRRGTGERGRLEAGFGGWSGLDVVGADVQAIVAAENPVAQLSPEVLGDRRFGAAQFDGQVGDAASGIDDVWLGDRAGRTGLDAERAASAEIGSRLIRLQLQGRQNFSQE